MYPSTSKLACHGCTKPPLWPQAPDPASLLFPQASPRLRQQPPLRQWLVRPRERHWKGPSCFGRWASSTGRWRSCRWHLKGGRQPQGGWRNVSGIESTIFNAVHTFANLRYDSPSWRLSPASREAAGRQMHARVAVKLASWTATEVMRGDEGCAGDPTGRGRCPTRCKQARDT